MKNAEDFVNGQLILIDKPLTWTSFQAVNKMKWALKSKLDLKKIKIGHAGTLDPLATGLLIVLENSPRELPKFNRNRKNILELFILVLLLHPMI